MHVNKYIYLTRIGTMYIRVCRLIGHMTAWLSIKTNLLHRVMAAEPLQIKDLMHLQPMMERN